MRRSGTRGTAMPAALAALAVSAALGAAIADLVRTEVVLAAQRRAASRALAAADRCLAQIAAGLPTGWTFDTLLGGPDGRLGTADDGAVAAPAGCTASAAPAPGPAAPPRALLVVDGRAGGGRRTIEAVVGRRRSPALPAVLWLGQPPPAIAGHLTLDGTDPAATGDPPWAALAGPLPPAALDAWLAAEAPQVDVAPGSAAPFAAPPPPIDELRDRLRAASPAGSEALVTSPAPPPGLALVNGDLVVTDGRHGAGLLFVDGTLDVQGTLDFSGIVVASGGIQLAAGARMTIDGALWVGTPGGAFTVAGDLTLRHDAAAIAAADALLGLPRPAAILGLRDLG